MATIGDEVAAHPVHQAWTPFGTTAAWGLTPLDDQQLGKLIMWAPAAAVYLAAALFLANRWLGESRAAIR